MENIYQDIFQLKKQRYRQEIRKLQIDDIFLSNRVFYLQQLQKSSIQNNQMQNIIRECMKNPDLQQKIDYLQQLRSINLQNQEVDYDFFIFLIECLKCKQNDDITKQIIELKTICSVILANYGKFNYNYDDIILIAMQNIINNDMELVNESLFLIGSCLIKNYDTSIDIINMIIDQIYELIDEKLLQLSLQIIKNIVWIANLILKKYHEFVDNQKIVYICTDSMKMDNDELLKLCCESLELMVSNSQQDYITQTIVEQSQIVQIMIQILLFKEDIILKQYVLAVVIRICEKNSNIKVFLQHQIVVVIDNLVQTNDHTLKYNSVILLQKIIYNNASLVFSYNIIYSLIDKLNKFVEQESNKMKEESFFCLIYLFYEQKDEIINKLVNQNVFDMIINRIEIFLENKQILQSILNVLYVVIQSGYNIKHEIYSCQHTNPYLTLLQNASLFYQINQFLYCEFQDIQEKGQIIIDLIESEIQNYHINELKK